MIDLPSLVGADVILEMISVAQECPDGCFVEVGVYKGGTAWYLDQLARKQRRLLFLYDTFSGIPYKDEVDNHNVGDFADTSFEAVRDALPYSTVVKGVFPESAVAMPPIAFVHLDCDQYRSIKESVAYLKPLMMTGGVIWFDDYGCLPGATKAVDELFPNVVRAKTNKVYVRIA